MESGCIGKKIIPEQFPCNRCQMFTYMGDDADGHGDGLDVIDIGRAG